MKPKLGIQLYSVREALGKDFQGTLRGVAKLGFQGVEFAWNYGGMSPEALVDFLAETGLTCCGFHTSLEKLLDRENVDYAYARALKSPYITISLSGSLAKDVDGLAKKVTEGAKIAKDFGIAFTYHNHNQEFEKINGAYVLDLFYQKTCAKLVQCELDTYWIKKGGEDPIAYLEKYAARLPQIHLKDFNPADEKIIELGRGCIDFKKVLDVAEKAGTKWVIYEQDYSSLGAMESAAISAKHILSLMA